MAVLLIFGPNGLPLAARTGVDSISFTSGIYTSRLYSSTLSNNRFHFLPERSGTLTVKSQLDEVSMIGTPAHQTSAANAAATIAIAAPGTGLSHQLNSLTFSYDKPPAGGLITVSSGAAIYYRQAIVTAGVGPVVPGIKLPANVPIDITLSAGGVGVIGYVSASLSVV